MSKILNIETSTDICSVAISEKGTLLSIQENTKGFNHAASLTILIQKCLNDAQITLQELDAVALSQGPGSYTGLRIGVSVAKGICYSLNKPMIAIDTLQALAWACAKHENQAAIYCPMIDARRMEVYTAMYDFQNKALSEVQSLIVDNNTFSKYFLEEKNLIFCGNGAEKCSSVITSEYAFFSPVFCSAAHMIALSYEYFSEEKFVDIAYFSPLYFKAPNITTPKKIL